MWHSCNKNKKLKSVWVKIKPQVHKRTQSCRNAHISITIIACHKCCVCVIVDSLLGQNINTSRKVLEPTESSVKSTMRNRRSLRALTSTCQRTNLYVDFTKLGWSGWIISPRGYNAYSCLGSCPFPLGEGLRATNHATVRSIMNALKLSQEAGKPCCVPDVLHPISLLYFDDEENVVLKQYNDMVAGSCGCH